MKTPEDLLQEWETELTEIDENFEKACNSDKMYTAFNYLGKKKQLIQCIVGLETLIKGCGDAKQLLESFADWHNKTYEYEGVSKGEIEQFLEERKK